MSSTCMTILCTDSARGYHEINISLDSGISTTATSTEDVRLEECVHVYRLSTRV